MTALSSPTPLRPLTTAARLGARRVGSQPGGLVFSAVFYLMVTAVLGGLWRTAATSNGGDIVGYSASALFWYIATAEAAVVSLPFRLIDDVGTDIDSGAVESELLRPVSPLGPRLATEIGSLLPRLGVCALTGLVLCWIVGGGPQSPAGLLLAGPSLVLAASLNATAQFVFAGATFWLRDARGAWFLYQKLVFVLGGMLLPLQVLPGTLETVARLLPFSAMAYAPARLASGHVEPELLAIQMVWLVLALAAAARVYRAGERRMTLAGASS